MTMNGKSVHLVVLALALRLLGGCFGEGAAEEGEATADGEGGGAATAVDRAPREPTVAAAQEALQGSAWRSALEGVLQGWGGERQPMTDLLRETYTRRGYRPVFLDGLWPGEAAAAVVKAVREVPSHGLPHSPYRPKVLIPLYEALALDRRAAEGALTEPASDNERLAKLEWQLPRSIYKTPRSSEQVPEVRYRPLKELPTLATVDAGLRCLLEAVQEAAEAAGAVDGQAAARCEQTGAPRGEAGLAKVRQVLEERQEQRAQLALLDALLLQAFYQWVLDFSIDARFHPFDSQGPVNRARLPREHQDELIQALGRAEEAEDFTQALRDHVPEDAEYGQLRSALARYVALMDEDEARELKVRGWLKRGEQGAPVEALQERLAVEGYFDGPAGGDFDEATHEAVVLYQRTHGLAEGGVVGQDTVESLNIPFEWRVKQLMVSLGRWRESPLSRRGEPGLFIRVNIPAFQLQVVEQGKTTRRHRVIVGSNRPFPDPVNDGVVWHSRRTKLFDTVLSEVVLNPTWIVPEAIRIDEIEPKVREIPNYLTDNNFRKVGELYVQGPGPTNPLGVVKFTLASTDSIYLHDTDKRLLFDETARAFSHGCIRVDEPVELAKFVLGRQKVAPERVDARVAEGLTLPLKVDEPIPVFIEYNTVGVTDEGRPVFYGDVYDYDVAYWKKRTPITRRFP